MKRLYFILLLAAVTLSVMAQNVGEAFYIYRNDGQFNAFFRDEVISIDYSYEDADGNTYDEIVTQIVNTADSVYKIPLAAIDSIGFVQPETKYTNSVVRMEPLLPYIISVDGLMVVFASNMPSDLMPRVGDVLLQDNFDCDKLPDGFAGKVIECNGQQVVCESVSFEDIYEQIVCYGSYTAVNDATNNSMKLVPRRAGGGIATAIGINGTVGSTGNGIYGTVNGQLGLDLRVTLKFGVNKPIYFDLSLAPELSLTLKAGVKGNFSNNVLSNKVTLIALPIPNSPFLLKLKAGPVLKYSVDASVTVTTEASLGYKFGVKYEDGTFKGYGQNTSKWFSTPDVTGSISGSVFCGVQTEFGIFSYGDLLSLSLDKEAGAEFVANLTEDLLNSDKYEELQNAHFDLNLKASAGVSAKAKFFKWLSAEANWELLSGQVNINSWKLVPTFQKPKVTVNNSTTANASVIPSEKLLFPVSIGLGVWDDDEILHAVQYCPNTYRLFGDWGLSQYQTTFTGLTPNKSYVVKPLVKLLGLEIPASPTETFKLEGETTCPDSNHPHMIDLGLPSGTKWACCNVGASSPEDYGGYYIFDLAQAYNPPSFEQIKELLNKCSYTWTTQNGVKGGKFTGPNGGTIFLPAAGYFWYGELDFVGSNGGYWSSTPYDESYGYALDFYSGSAYWGSSYRDNGLSVRPVRKN